MAYNTISQGEPAGEPTPEECINPLMAMVTMCGTANLASPGKSSSGSGSGGGGGGDGSGGAFHDFSNLIARIIARALEDLGESGDVSDVQDFIYEETLYRSDTRNYNVVFADGFKPVGDNMNLVEHVAGEDNSGFVGTTKYSGIASARGGNVYVIDETAGIDVNEVWPDNPHASEVEVAVPGEIPSGRIEGVYLTNGDWVENPNYLPGG
jgi:hypothetical protein